MRLSIVSSTMLEVVFHGVKIQVAQGNIADQPDIDAIVNAANAQLRPGGGVAGAIHQAAGPGLDAECRSWAPISPGEAVLTGGHNLPNRFVVHCLGPVYGKDTPASELLASCYRNALTIADHRGACSIAFPAVSTGVFGYPPEAAARIAQRTIIGEMRSLTSIRLIRFVLFGRGDLQIHEDVLHELAHLAHEQ